MSDDARELFDALERTERERDAWKKLANGQLGLLVAYRLGTRPKEKSFRLIDAANEELIDLGVSTNPADPGRRHYTP